MKAGRYNFGSRKWKVDETDTLFQVKVNSIFMLHRRGYVIPPEEASLVWNDYESQYRIKKMEFISYMILKSGMNVPPGSPQFGTEDFVRYMMLTSGFSLSRDHLSSTYSKADGTVLGVQFMDSRGKSTISDGDVSSIIQMNIGPTFNVRSNNKIMLIVATDLSPAAKATVNGYRSENIIDIEVIQDGKLLVDPSVHIFDSSYVKLSPQEATAFYRGNKLDPSKIPQFAVDDPTVTFNGWIPGDLIRVYRRNTFTNGLAENSITYRVVTTNSVKK